MQEDKEPFFDASDTVVQCIEVMTQMLPVIKVKKENLLQGVKKGFLNATEAADYLVMKGAAFRDAHGIIGKVVLYAEEMKKPVEELTLEELQQFSALFEEDVYQEIDYELAFNKGIKKEMK
jgi:argininosuccinate lyase